MVTLHIIYCLCSALYLSALQLLMTTYVIGASYYPLLKKSFHLDCLGLVSLLDPILLFRPIFVLLKYYVLFLTHVIKQSIFLYGALNRMIVFFWYLHYLYSCISSSFFPLLDIFSLTPHPTSGSITDRTCIILHLHLLLRHDV